MYVAKGEHWEKTLFFDESSGEAIFIFDGH
jgi:hypothetical protein